MPEGGRRRAEIVQRGGVEGGDAGFLTTDCTEGTDGGGFLSRKRGRTETRRFGILDRINGIGGWRWMRADGAALGRTASREREPYGFTVQICGE